VSIDNDVMSVTLTELRNFPQLSTNRQRILGKLPVSKLLIGNITPLGFMDGGIVTF